MSLTLRKKVFITAALTGSGGTQNKSLNVPRSPQQISKAAIAAARGGARCSLSSQLFCGRSIP